MNQAVTIKPMDEIQTNLKRMEPEFAKALPAHVTVEKFTRVALTAIKSNPDILDADRNSLWAELMKCASDGMICDGREAAMVVYKTKAGKVAKYLIMIGGILKKIRNSGELLNLTAEVVFENDAFEYWNDEVGPHLKHRPLLTGDRGKIILTYATANTKSGGTYIEIVPEVEMAKIRNVSRAKDTGPWSGDFANEMRKKSAIRRLSKRLPMSTDLEEVVRSDDDLTDFTLEPKKSESPNQDRLMKLIEKSELHKDESHEVEIADPFEKKDGASN